ncbi:hypothetical protein L9F63_019680, partial [Diploptera punctata]
ASVGTSSAVHYVEKLFSEFVIRKDLLHTFNVYEISHISCYMVQSRSSKRLSRHFVVKITQVGSHTACVFHSSPSPCHADHEILEKLATKITLLLSKPSRVEAKAIQDYINRNCMTSLSRTRLRKAIVKAVVEDINLMGRKYSHLMPGHRTLTGWSERQRWDIIYSRMLMACGIMSKHRNQWPEADLESMTRKTQNFNPLLSGTSSVRTRVIVLQNDLPSRAFVVQCTTELHKCLDIAGSIYGLSRFKKFNQNIALSSLFSLMANSSGAIPYSGVLFQARSDETSFRHLSQYSLWSSLNKRGTQRALTFRFVAISFTVIRLSSLMSASTLSLLQSVEAERISVSTLKSLVNINSRLFLFNKEFNDSALSKRNIDVCHFGNTTCGHMIEAMTPQNGNVV